MNWIQIALIALGGALGAVARFGVGSWIVQRFPGSNFPWATFIINASGSFVLGLILTLVSERFLTNQNIRPLIATGFIGAYTTFSTFEYESLQLGSSFRALLNLLGSVVAGYFCVWLGSYLAQQIVAIAHSVRTAR